jgi:hypothetical protein
VEDVRAIDLLAKSAKQQHKAVTKELQQLKVRQGSLLGLYGSITTPILHLASA